MKFLNNVDLNANQLQNALLHPLGSDPGSPVDGQVWVNTTSNTLKIRLNGVTVALGRLDQISAPTASVSLNSQKITNLATPTATGEAANYDYVNGRRLDQAAAPTASVSLNSQKITNLADGTGTNDAVNKSQLDNAIAGLSWKDEVRAATTAAGTLATSFENADVIDGVTLATGDRILIKNQAAGAENGIYTVNASGAPTRATDADTASEITGAAVLVNEGTANGDTGWVLQTNAPITVGTTSLTFAKFFGGSSSGTNKYTTTVGNGSLTSIAVTHNLGTTAVVVSVYRSNAQVYPDVTITDSNTVTLTYAVAPTTNQDTIVVIG